MKKIIFNDRYGLTQAVLEGRKTMTRRICKYSRPDETYDIVFPIFGPNDFDNNGNNISPLNYAFGWMDNKANFIGWNIPKYKVGEVVAIAQPYRDIAHLDDGFLNERYEVKDEYVAGWANKMFVRSDLMPHHIRITDIKIERLQNISEDECIKEGIRKWTKDEELFKYDLADGFEIFEWKDKPRNSREAFAALINSISGKGTFSKNPYVFAYKFELVD